MAKSEPAGGRVKRFLRSRRDRYWLWRAAGGRCPDCGEPLQESFHADHVVPWSRRKRTNVHEMQGRCPRCNLKKGNR
jgi:5-methylcytosine-specific restriction endonuclease McrA